MALKTDYKDDQLDLDVNLNRRFRLNAVSGETDVYEFEDVTEYDVEGDRFGANDINSTNEEINNISSNLTEYTYAVAVADWETNSDVGTDTTYYTKKAVVSASGVSGNSPFQWHMDGSGLIPTESETESINMVLEAIANVNTVTLYAIDAPTVALNFVMVGGR